MAGRLSRCYKFLMIVILAGLTFLALAAAGLFWAIRRDDSRRHVRKPSAVLPAEGTNADVAAYALLNASTSGDGGCDAGGGDCGGGD